MMDITASQGKFYIAMMRTGDWKYKWNKNGTLSIAGGRGYPIHVTTYSDDFIEAIDAEGRVLADGGDGDWFYFPEGKETVTLRFKKLPDTNLTPPEIKKARRKTTVHVVDQQRHDSGPFQFGASYADGSLGKVIASLQKIRDGIPKQYRAKARCEIDSKSGYEDSHYAHVEISYERPETDAEVIHRVQIERERSRIAENKERAQLVALKSKFAKLERDGL